MKQRILVIRLGSLGDIILASSAIINLKIQFPDSHISFLCKERFRQAAELIRGVDEIITIEDGISLPRYVRVLMDLDRKNFSIVVDLQGNPRSLLARKFITADQTVVYPKRRMERMLSVKRKIIPRSWPHTIELYNEAIIELGAKAVSFRPVLRVAARALNEPARQFAERNNRYVVFAPGAAHPNKQWPIERFAETASRLHKNHGVGIVWAVTESDNSKAMPEGIPPMSLLKVVDCPLGDLVQLIASARLTVANDSGIAHASSAVGTPVIAIFGPTHPALGFAPRGMFDRVIDVDEGCRPCSLHGKKPCYRDSRYCFDRIDPDEVVDAAETVLEFRDSVSPAVFVDRDGTVMVDKDFLSDPDDIEFETDSVEALRILRKSGFKLVIISNQSGVARGYFDTEDVEMVNGRLMELLASAGVDIDAVFYCPHHPRGTVPGFAVTCPCRKPAPGMIEAAVNQLNLDLRNSFVVGDKVEDMDLARVIGATPLMVRTGYGSEHQGRLATGRFHDDIVIVDNLLQAAGRIVGGICHD